MIEIPEAQTLARQMLEALKGKTIVSARAATSPHGFAWYFGDPADYDATLAGRTVTGAVAFGGHPELMAQDARLAFCDGVNVRYFEPGAMRPAKHQLELVFDDDSAIVCTVQMYGAMWAFPEGANDNEYYLVAMQKTSPLDPAFDQDYFATLNTDPKLSAKAFLATEQRIPGLGNGVLQDILWTAGIHPRRKMGSLSETEFAGLFSAAKTVLAEMTAQGGRDTERDLFGNPGGYEVALSRNTCEAPCHRCGGAIVRQAYLGGNIYFCDNCQKL